MILLKKQRNFTNITLNNSIQPLSLNQIIRSKLLLIKLNITQHYIQHQIPKDKNIFLLIIIILKHKYYSSFHKSMNKLTSLKQVSAYRPKPLSPQTHKTLTKQLQNFKLNPDYSYLKATYQFPRDQYNNVVDKMNTIGQIADNMDHHPEWTLKGQTLEIGLSTHECQGKVSIKDYILASWIEQIWNDKPLQDKLIQNWNQKQISIDELK